MNVLVKKIIRFLAAEDGPTAVEYAAMLLLVFLACLSAINLFGQMTAGSIEDSSSALEEVLDSSR